MLLLVAKEMLDRNCVYIGKCWLLKPVKSSKKALQGLGV